MTRRKLTPKQKAEILEEQGFLCQACSTPLEEGRVDYDHIVPLCLGGGNELTNFRGICRACHKGKTKNDVRMKSKADRTGKKHRGEQRPSRHPMQKTARKIPSRPFKQRRGFARG